ncbi:ABC transporter permease [Propioniciclava coleopterorum]|uniref:ABC transporter permease n=1 Tax=Propioniciclava coleopterorum TaxID=2714937 RepID=A0A6G7Y2W0_9ACTN|nr:ABC transporter permease [Propioniciclava coleopterorum]QIK71113.1 ABC transporter permease [Propioniciclava coleopterorum]
MTDALLTAAPRRRTEPGAWWAIIVLIVVLAYAALVPLLAPAALHEVDLAAAREAPSPSHLFGTDNSGRDLFVRVAEGMRVSLLIALVCALTSTLIGVAVGTVAAVAGGVVDGALMRATDATNALPHLLLGIVIVAFFPGSLTAIIASIALTHWPQVARIVRSVAVTTRRMEFVDAAYLAGATHRDVAFRHVVPAASGQSVVAVVLLLPHAIWHESTLSFLGLGLAPDRASLGTLLQISRGEVMIGGWWTLAFPAAALVVTAFAIAGLAGAAQRRVAPIAEGRVT